MSPKQIRIALILLLLIGLMGVPILTSAMSSPGYRLISDTLQGGAAGGGLSSSAGYQLEGSFGGAILVSATSTSFNTCSGFVCSGIAFIRNLFLPLVLKQ